MRSEDHCLTVDSALSDLPDRSLSEGPRGPVWLKWLYTGLERPGQKLLRELVALLVALPDRHQMALVDVDLDSRKDEDAEFPADLVQNGPPDDTVVVGDRNYLHSGVKVRLQERASERLIRLRTPDVAVAMILVGGGMDLKVGQEPARESH